MNYATRLESHEDSRGTFVELIRNSGGQISFSTSAPGVTRGDHYHTRKVEKFIVVGGKARIRLRHLDSNHVECIDVDDTEIVAVDIGPCVVHNITNTGNATMRLILWCNELFDPQDPDTTMERVEREGYNGTWHKTRNHTDIAHPQET